MWSKIESIQTLKPLFYDCDEDKDSGWGCGYRQILYELKSNLLDALRCYLEKDEYPPFNKIIEDLLMYGDVIQRGEWMDLTMVCHYFTNKFNLDNNNLNIIYFEKIIQVENIINQLSTHFSKPNALCAIIEGTGQIFCIGGIRELDKYYQNQQKPIQPVQNNNNLYQNMVGQQQNLPIYDIDGFLHQSMEQFGQQQMIIDQNSDQMKEKLQFHDFYVIDPHGDYKPYISDKNKANLEFNFKDHKWNKLNSFKFKGGCGWVNSNDLLIGTAEKGYRECYPNVQKIEPQEILNQSGGWRILLIKL